MSIKLFNNYKKIKMFLGNILYDLKSTEDIVKENLIANFDARNIENYSENSLIDNIGGFRATLGNGVALDPNNISNQGLICKSNYTFEINGLNDIKDINKGFTIEIIQSRINKESLFYNINNYFSFSYTDTSDKRKTVGIYEHNYIDENNLISVTNSVFDPNKYVHLQCVLYSNGIGKIFINGFKGYLDVSPTDFKSYDDLFLSTTRLKFNNDTTDTVFSCLRIYNRALTDSELKNNLFAEINKLEINNVELLPKNITIKKGSEFSFYKDVNPDVISNRINYNLNSLNNNVSVINSHTIKANTVGSSEVTLNSNYKNKNITDKVNCTIVDSLNFELPTLQRPEYTGVVIGNKINSLYIDEEYALMAFLIPYMPNYDNIIKFKTSNSDVCSINYGVLKANSTGKCVITATDPEGLYSDSFTIEILGKPIESIDESEIYYVDIKKYGISIDNTNGINTTKGIINALDYASNNNFKKIVFPKGTYLTSIYANETIDDTIYTTGTIKIPSNMIVDFSNSIINIEPVNSGTIKYSMFAFQGNCKNSKIINATIYGEKETMSISPNKSEEHSLCVLFYDAENCGLENCTIGKSNGFNIQGLRGIRSHSFNYASIMQDNIEAGSYDDNGEKDDNNINNNWRTIDKIDISMIEDHFELGHVQAYSGYLISARLYDIIFYDENGTFIEVQRNCVQFFRYNTPVGAKYANLVFHQPTQPTGAGVGDHSYMISLYTLMEPYKCYIKNCVIRDNHSTGIAMCGGKRWLIENNHFINNYGRDPSAHVDYEDGWDSMIGDVWRYNIFEKGGGGFLNVDGHSLVVHNNIFNFTGFDQRDRCQNYRIYNNVFNNCIKVTLSCQNEGVAAENILYNTEFRTQNYFHDTHMYDVRYFNNYTIK